MRWASTSIRMPFAYSKRPLLFSSSLTIDVNGIQLALKTINSLPTLIYHTKKENPEYVNLANAQNLDWQIVEWCKRDRTLLDAQDRQNISLSNINIILMFTSHELKWVVKFWSSFYPIDSHGRRLLGRQFIIIGWIKFSHF